MNSKTIAAAFVMVVALLKGVAFADEPAPLYVREVQINAQIDDIRFVQRAVVTNPSLSTVQEYQ